MLIKQGGDVRLLPLRLPHCSVFQLWLSPEDEDRRARSHRADRTVSDQTGAGTRSHRHRHRQEPGQARRAQWQSEGNKAGSKVWSAVPHGGRGTASCVCSCVMNRLMEMWRRFTKRQPLMSEPQALICSCSQIRSSNPTKSTNRVLIRSWK